MIITDIDSDVWQKTLNCFPHITVDNKKVSLHSYISGMTFYAVIYSLRYCTHVIEPQDVKSVEFGWNSNNKEIVSIILKSNNERKKKPDCPKFDKQDR